MGWPKGVRRKGYKNGTMPRMLAKRTVPVFESTALAAVQAWPPPISTPSRMDVIKRQTFSPYDEVGYTGLKQISGFLQEEFLQDLRGQKGARIYREMVDNSADIGAFLQIVKRLLQQVNWHHEPFSEKDEHVKQAEWFDQALEDMEHSWPEVLSEITSMLQYGYAPMEVTLKIRRGWSKDPSKRSKFDDGQIGWRKMSLRAQDSVWRWVYDEDQRKLLAMSTLPAPLYSRVDIPMDKILNFRMDVEKENPEGRSILRSAYQDYYMAKRLTAIAAIGAERNLAGIPVMYIPADCMRADATQAERAVYTRARQIVENLRVDEQSGIVMPQQFDVDTKEPLYKIELLSVAGTSKGLDVESSIKRHQTNMLRAVLSDWLMLGTGDTGSWSLSSDRTDQFGVILGGIMDIICGVMNRQAIPALAELNGWDIAELPTLKHGDVESPDLEKLGNFLQKCVGSGVILPDQELEDYVRETAHLPARTESDEDSGIRTRIIGGEEPPPPVVPGMPGAPGKPGQPVKPGVKKPAAQEGRKPKPAADQTAKINLHHDDSGRFAEGPPAAPVGATRGRRRPDDPIEKTPPWKVVERDGKWLVVGQENGKTYGSHGSKEEALANMRALYANVNIQEEK